ncbi:MAG: IclR family transcriptional regulator, partial [Thermomicrobiales bacterium]|nr:IclR family transcriptional regulator [Thermomicrobiales bacterium]
ALTEACGHASYIGVPAGRHYVFLIAVESTRSVRVTIDVGENRAYHSGAIGKVLLADLDDDEVIELTGTAPFPQLTPKTIVSPNDLLKEIAEIRQTGVAFNREESILGASSIAVAIRDSNERAVAGLAIVFPSHIVDDEEIARFVPLVQATGREISHRLGALHLDSFEGNST